MRTLIYIGRRLLYLVPQALGISIVTFVIVRLLPGNPAIAIAGPRATTGMIQQIQHEMGLDRPLWTQYGIYLGNILRGDFGRSWVTSNAVTTDLAHRVPATLELITIALFLSVVIGIPLGMLAASKRRGGPLRYLTNTYGGLAGAVPDFWLGLILIFVFYVQLHWAPSPVGRLDLEVLPPEEVTGLLTVDSLLEGNWEALRSALSHLALPVITLVFIYMAPIVKMTRSSMEEVLRSSHVEYGEALGLPPNRIMLRALRNAAPPVVTIFGGTVRLPARRGGAGGKRVLLGRRRSIRGTVNRQRGFFRHRSVRADRRRLHPGGLPAGRPGLFRPRSKTAALGVFR